MHVGAGATTSRAMVRRADATHPLVRAGAAHAQFETIHPFRDGNGRVGRMIVLLMLLQSGVFCRCLRCI